MELWWIAALSLVPWVELRGAIPVALAQGHPPLRTFLLCTLTNLLIIAPGWTVLDLCYHRFLSRFGWIKRQVDRIRRQGTPYVHRYELLGLALFVAMPLPGTGAYAGTLLAWLLGLPRGKAWAAIAVGVAIAGLVVTAVSIGAVEGLRRIW
ncbi:MAG: small multi-drug export protein [Armatimonadota bacterium]|nr:small multi-drug export protein [Armatimonadota bacterium]MDR7439956.1 small multi-drug export protein [Armatimonadota bacterium]MDR7562379.1 small multi-drug export protein [Armatimonadota bacterium]MDR7567074.1 small multi-drug export protein [Armatimonadota bacterium]MDR7601539.1 small multi-drug export protein [Armatimonadota bacterium]